jgi:hypothetical protein
MSDMVLRNVGDYKGCYFVEEQPDWYTLFFCSCSMSNQKRLVPKINKKRCGTAASGKLPDLYCGSPLVLCLAVLRMQNLDAAERIYSVFIA